MLCANLHPEAMLAFFQATQLNLFERFLTQARSGIDSTGITAGMQNVAYVVLLVGFLWQVYQSALHGGDVRGLGTSLIKYVVTAVVVMNYGAVFTTINQGFVNAGNWVSNASGALNLLENWKNDVQTQFNQVGFQKMWGLITGDLPGLLDALLIIVGLLRLSDRDRRVRLLLHLLRQHSVYLRSNRDCSDASRRRKPPRQVICREHLHLECMADSLRRLRGAVKCSSDGPTRADAQLRTISSVGLATSKVQF